MSIQDNLLDPDTVASLVRQPDGDQGPADGATQWRLDLIQVVNWGGFEGWHKLPIHANGTLLSGGSGTGKSTLLDAYTALMMPSSVAFNGASNDSGVGRARNEQGGQRTLLTYLRGKQGVNDDSGGATSENLLRGKGAATWGAISATFRDNTDAVFSVLRVFFVPAGAADVASIQSRMATVDGPVLLGDLDGAMATHTAAKPLANLITSTWRGATVKAKYSEFSHIIFKRLGIGANGDGAKALELLARIQAGRSVNSVNALYRDLVLDTPATFKNADLALAHFDTLDDDLKKMIEAERKHAMLADIRDVHDKLQAARARAATLDEYGLHMPGFTKLTAWSLRKEIELLEAAEDAAATAHRSASATAKTAKATADATYRDLDKLKEEYRIAGGEELLSLDTDIEDTTASLEVARASKSTLAGFVAVVGGNVDSQGGFDAVLQDAHAFDKRRETSEDEHQKRRDALRDRIKPLQEREAELVADIKHLNESGTRIRGTHAAARDMVAARLGLKPSDLPYVAELIDVAPGQEDWRNAIETILGGDASRIVLPADKAREYSKILDQVKGTGTIRFVDGIPDKALRYDLNGATSPDQAGRVVGKLIFDDHPYAGWVQAYLAGSGGNALCVDMTDDLYGPGQRITKAGQTRSGDRSQIGRSRPNDILGFSNVADLEYARAELAQVREELTAVLKALEGIENERRVLARRGEAYAAIKQFRWDDVDLNTIAERLAKLVARRDTLKAADDVLATLGDQISDLEEEYHKDLEDSVAAKNAASAAEKIWTRVITTKDARTETYDKHVNVPTYGTSTGVGSQRDTLGARGGGVGSTGTDGADGENGTGETLGEVLGEVMGEFDLTAAQEADLAQVYASVVAHAGDEDPVTVADRFDERLGLMHNHLDAQLRTTTAEIGEAERALAKTFTQFSGEWGESNLGTSHESYLDYLRILDELEQRGLYETRAEWQATVAQWSGEDLLPLAQSLSGEIEAIKARIVPINDILKEIPFGARRGRLQLKVADVVSESVRQFRARLRRMTTLATKQMSFEETKRAFAELSVFMDTLRDAKDPRHNADRSDRVKLLDVRRHVEVYAVEHPAPGDTSWLPREHRQLGSASGGESQELIAFIIGSALRFRLGDELRSWPRFAPVFLDEGFVKADSAHAGRAMDAWRKLRFQVIVGTPEDKVTGLERHMDAFVVIYKDPVTGYSFIDHVTDADERSVSAGWQPQHDGVQ